MQLPVLLALVRRDYRLQYAGSILGSSWLLVEYILQALLFYLVFRFVFQKSPDPTHLAAGLLFWLPLVELILKTSSSLSRNRSLIRRTTTSADLFVQVPVVQAMVQFTLFFVLALPLFLLAGKTSLTAAISAYVFGLAFFFCISFPARILAWQSLLFRDLAPLLRIFFPALFWTLPVVYAWPMDFLPFLDFHPLAFPLTQFQGWLAGTQPVSVLPFALYTVAGLGLYAIGRHFLYPLALDEL